MRKIMVAGATGRMGMEVIRYLARRSDSLLVAALAANHDGADVGEVAGIGRSGVRVTTSLDDALAAGPEILIDFTRREAALLHIERAAARRVACIVGTTGFTKDDLAAMERWAATHNTPIFVAPNFSLGAVLMMRFAAEAARHFSWAEIIELHHEKKADAPSGTALRTAALMQAARPEFLAPEHDPAAPSRGLDHHGIRLHSVRLPGLVAHQEVLLGAPGETLSIRHDSTHRESFMAGVGLALDKIATLNGLVVGLESLMG